MDCFGVVHLAVAFTVVHDEDEAAFVANAHPSGKRVWFGVA